MPNTIAEYYSEELVEWSRNIDFHNEEMNEFEERLKEVIQRNSILDIAAKVEHYQDQLNSVSKKLFALHEELYQQETKLKTDSTLVDNSLISAEMEKQQNALRRRMQAAEKEYIDVKYACYDFLSGTLKK